MSTESGCNGRTCCDCSAPTPNLTKTRKRVLTRRGVIWLGQTCDLRCFFCYFLTRIADNKHPQHPFMSLDKAKAICKTLRNFYGNNAIDIQGGEPAIYPEIIELVSYCREIGLYPTLITNGLRLSKPGELERHKDAGVRDFLVSMHGIGETHDEVVRREGAFDKMTKAIERMCELDIPRRFNCTMTRPVVSHITTIAQKAIDYGVYGVNFIAFNDFVDQTSGQRSDKGVAPYSEIKPQLTEAIDMLEEAGIETNVRYVPMCVAEPRHRKNFYNFQQLSYDAHEWDFQSWMWTMHAPQCMKEGDLSPVYKIGPYSSKLYRCDPCVLRDHYKKHPVKRWIKFKMQHLLAGYSQSTKGKEQLYREEAIIRAKKDCHYKHIEACEECSLRTICDGFHGDYTEFYGSEEAKAINDIPPTNNPLEFIKDQDKIVEPEDMSWAS